MSEQGGLAPGTRPAFLALGCVGAFAGVPAQAEAVQDQPPHPVDLGGMTVTDTAITDGSYKTDRADSPRYTAPLVDTPRSITVIPQQLIKDTASTTLAEALRTVPGITLGAGEGGNPLGDRPFIRGFDSSNSTYIDGVRDPAAQVRETFDIDTIEVVKGSDSVTSGYGNAGGSINIVSKKPTADRFIQADGALGSADYRRATVDINEPVNDLIGVRLNGMYHDQHFAGRDEVYQKRWGIAPAVTIGLTGPTSLTLEYYHLHTSELPDSGIPYLTVIGNQPDADSKTKPVSTALRPRDAFYGLVDRDFRRTNTDEGSARFQHDFGAFKLRNTASFTHVTQNYVWSQPDDSKGNVYTYGTVGRRALSRYASEDGLIDQLDLSGHFDTFGLKHSLTASAEYDWLQSSYGNYVSDAALGTALPLSIPCPTPTSGTNFNCTSLANPTPHDPWTGSIVRSLPKTRTLARSEVASAALFDTITVTDWLLFNLGGRYDHYRTTASPALAATATTERSLYRQSDDLWTYQAGVLLKPTPDGTIYFSTGKAAVPPGSFLAQGSEDNALTTSATISADDLKVQKTTSYEVGAKWQLFGDSLLLSADLFQTRTTNARTTNPDGTVSYIGTRRVRGAEVSYNGNVTDRWTVFGGFVYQPSKVTSAGSTATTVGAVTIVAPAAATGHPFPNTPRYSFTTFTNYKITPKLTVGGGVIYQGRVYGGFTDSRTIQNGQLVILKTRATYAPAYWRFDANASYQLTSRIGLGIQALNLTNKLYYDQVYPTHYAHQAAGRTVIGSVSVRY